eukprot:8901274-Pyramimonas_sp.AAC.1
MMHFLLPDALSVQSTSSANSWGPEPPSAATWQREEGQKETGRPCPSDERPGSARSRARCRRRQANPPQP